MWEGKPECERSASVNNMFCLGHRTLPLLGSIPVTLEYLKIDSRSKYFKPKKSQNICNNYNSVLDDWFPTPKTILF